MCGLFSWFGGIMDLIQRVRVFIMTCCITSAVCCSFVTASMSGIALGYNYSLAEYIDLKDMNVSIYLKRGIFDDEINDDMEFRRSNRLPIQGHLKDENLMTGASDESTTLRSGRRLDDSLYQSDDKNNFDDALMKPTVKPPDYSSNVRPKEWSVRGPYQDISIVPNFPDRSYPGGINPMRRMPWYSPLSIDHTTMGRSSLRDAVPARNINDPIVWMYPKVPEHALPSIMRALSESPTYPTTITPRAEPVIPTRSTDLKPKPKSTKPLTEGPEEVPKSIEEDLPRGKENEFNENRRLGKKPDEDYDYKAKGIPVRSRRIAFKLG